MNPVPDPSPAVPAAGVAPPATNPSQAPSTRGRGRRSGGVLLLSPGAVEWVTRGPTGEPVLQRVQPARPDAEAWAEAAQAAIGAGEPRKVRVTLVLGNALGQESVLELPPLRPGPLRSVLARRTEYVLGEPATFAAVPLASADGAQARRWLAVSYPRSRLTAIHRALESRGFEIAGTLPASAANLAIARSVIDPTAASAVVVMVEPERVVVSLFVQGVPQLLTALPGNLVESTVLGAALVHELRSLDAQWRKDHQGAQIAQLAILGLSSHRGRALGSALASVMPGARQVRVPEEAGSTDLARAHVLASALDLAGDVADLYEPPPRGRRIAVGGAALVTLGLATGWWLAEEPRAEARRLAGATARFEAASRDVDDLSAARDELAALVARVEGELVLADRASDAGFDLPAALVGVQRAFGPEFRIEEQRLDTDGIRVTGRRNGSASDGLRALGESAVVLDAEPWLQDARVVPLRRGGDDSIDLPFELRGTWRKDG